MANLTKADLKEALKGLATEKTLKDVAGDVVRVEKDVEGLRDDVKELRGDVDGLVKDTGEVPKRDEFPELLKETLEWATLKAEHERIKKILHEKLGVEV